MLYQTCVLLCFLWNKNVKCKFRKMYKLFTMIFYSLSGYKKKLTEVHK